MTTKQVSTVRRRRLGAELRRLREAAGMTLEDAAKVLECSDSKISRIETGHIGIRTLDLRVLLARYGVEPGPRYDALLRLARESRMRGHWLQKFNDVLTDPFRDFIRLEEDVASMRSYEIQLVPGLLQTEDYARAVIEAARVLWHSREEIDKFVALRMERQRVLTKERPLHLWAVLGEAALRCVVGGPEIMRAQLHRLLEVHHDLPHVAIQVLPFSAGPPAGIGGPFVILEFPDPVELDVLYLENLGSNLYIEDDDEIRRYQRAFDHLRSAALSPKDSASLIEKVAKEL